MDNVEVIRNKLRDSVQNTSDDADITNLLPFMQKLFTTKEMKEMILHRLQHNNEVITSLYFQAESNVFFKYLPKQIILNKIFPFLLFQSPNELNKIPIVNKFFKKLIFEYHLIHSANRYKIHHFIPILHKTSQECKPLIHVNHQKETITIAAPMYADNDGNNTQKQNEEFTCRAINDYYASVADELDLKEGKYYTIMQTSESGWWYAVNEDGEDGWVPSMYLERTDNKNSKLINYNISEHKFENLELDIHLSSFPYRNVRFWNICDLPTEDNENEMKTDNNTMIDIVLKSFKNIHFLVAENVTTTNLWNNDKFRLKQCLALIIKGQIMFKSFINLPSLLTNNLVCLDFSNLMFRYFRYTENKANQLQLLNDYSFSKDDDGKVTEISLKSIHESLTSKNVLNVKDSNIYWELSKLQFKMEIISFILEKCGTHLLIFTYCETHPILDRLNNEIMDITRDNFRMKGCLRIPSNLQWLRLSNVNCVIDLHKNKNKLFGVCMHGMLLNGKQFTHCKQKYITKFVVDKHVYKINEKTSENVKDTLFFKGGFTSVGAYLMQTKNNVDQIDINQQINNVYCPLWRHHNSIWLKNIF